METKDLLATKIMGWEKRNIPNAKTKAYYYNNERIRFTHTFNPETDWNDLKIVESEMIRRLDIITMRHIIIKNRGIEKIEYYTAGANNTFYLQFLFESEGTTELAARVNACKKYAEGL